MNLGIDKEKLSSAYISGNMNYFFKEASKITNYLLVQKYKFRDEEEREDVKQDCLLNLYKKHLEGKIKKYDADGKPSNLMSFIWSNSNFRILDHLKKKTNRGKKVQFISYDEYLENVLSEEDLED